MSQTDYQSLPPIIQDLILDLQINGLENGLLNVERTTPDDPLLPSGWVILHAMKHERQCRHNAYAAIGEAEPEDVNALIIAEIRRRDGGSHAGV